jgi:hypothetical protein
MSEPHRQLGWPAAATLITAMVGAAAAALAVDFETPRQLDFDGSRYASAREIGEVKARLTAIEVSTQQLRVELRSDIKELRELLSELVKNKQVILREP